MTVEYQKVWRTMNELEMVTSKICSAREIIDAAIDRIQEHQYDKAETMMSAAYEFLGYYLDEFDEKFKDAWQETVVARKEENPAFFNVDTAGNMTPSYISPVTCDKDDQSPECKGAWNNFWDSEEVSDDCMPPWGHSDMEALKYTDEELNAMCDKAASDEEKNKCREYNLREAEYYNKRAELDLNPGPHQEHAGWQTVSEFKFNTRRC